MRIISSFHDYYDSIQAYGQDPNLVYHRECALVKVPSSLDRRLLSAVSDWTIWYEREPRFRLLIVGFCGGAFPVFVDARQKCGLSDLTTHKGVSAIAYKEIFEYARQCQSVYLRTIKAKEAYIERVQRGLSGIDIGDSLFIACQAPVFFLFTSQRWWWGSQPHMELYTNPRLSNVNFASLVDPFTAYQEVAMFQGSQLAVEDKAPRTVGDDKIIAASKGFDEQSFITNFAGEKEQKRKANRARKRNLGGKE